MNIELATVWLFFCTFLVYMMQLGFLFLESGFVRKKNNSSVALQNFIDFAFGFMIFILFGYAVYSGPSIGGIIGKPTIPNFENLDTLSLVKLLYMAGFATTTGTIVSGVIAERLDSKIYAIIICLISILCFPFVAHWVWNPEGFLAKAGFIDMAGSAVVHFTGGVAGLATLFLVGTRRSVNLSKNIRPSPSNHVEIVFGCFLLILCWIGFNAGFESLPNKKALLITINTLVAACSGFIFVYISEIGKKVKSIPKIVNGGLGGVVAITACAHLYGLYGAILIGGISGLLVVQLNLWLDEKIDDAVGGISVHLGGGMIGVLATPFFYLSEKQINFSLYFHQLEIQIFGLIVIFLWVFLIIALFLKILNRIIPLRVAAESENKGLNYEEYGISDELDVLLAEMTEQISKEDFSHRVNVEGFTVVGQIANKYNEVTKVVCDLFTRQKELEVKIVQASSLSATGVMASGLAHEINNPLGIIKLSVSAIKKCLKKEGFENEFVAENLVDVDKTIERIVKIIRGLRNITRNSNELEMSVFLVSDVYDDSLFLARERCHQAGIKLIVDSRIEMRAKTLYGDRVQICQVLLNLFNNAYDAIEEASFHEKWIELQSEVKEDFLEIRVIDCGLGIEESVLAKIFNPFFTTKDIGKGTGIGLSVSKSMMKCSGGEVRYELYKGHTSFVMKIKRALDEV